MIEQSRAALKAAVKEQQQAARLFEPFDKDLNRRERRRRANPKHRGARFVQQRVGLHYLCFRARERADLDTCYELVQRLGATIVHPPEAGAWAPGYSSWLFEPPDGIRQDINPVPGRGLLA